MNMLMVDIRYIPSAQAGTQITLLGKDGEEEVSADIWAAWIGGANYEAIFGSHPDVTRIPIRI